MAIEINEFKLPMSPSETTSYLQRSTDAFGVFLDRDRIQDILYTLNEEQWEIVTLMRSCYNPRLNVSKKIEVIDALIEFGVPAQMFGINHNLLNQEIIDTIIKTAEFSDLAKAFATGYGKYSTNKNRMGTLMSYITKLPISDRWSKDGHRMLVAKPKWKLLSTSRQATSDPNVQAIPREYKDIVCEPEGYNLVRCDSSQIEPRINFSYYLRDELIINLINAYGDAYFGLLAYCLMSDEDEALYRQDFSKFIKKEVSDEYKAKRQNIKRLTNAGSYGSTNLGNVNAELAEAYNRKIVHHPKRLELENNIKERVHAGQTTFFGAFGTPVVPDATTKYTPGTPGWENHVVRCGINNPVQTTASELMIFSVNEARKILENSISSHICFYKHDEACFYVSDADKANGLIEQLSDITAYNVKGWIPIPADAEYGVVAPGIAKFIE